MLEDAAEAQLVLEAVPAERAVQDEVYGRLDAICPPPAVFASGSGQPASELVSNVRHRGRVVAAHFWYPPQLIPLVEVCAGPETDPDVAPWLCDVLRAAGKEPVIVDKEVPGFIGNRLQYAILREAWALWAEGAASAEAIDTVMKASLGRRLAVTGPIESADVGGLDTLHAFGAYLIPHLTTGSQPASAVTALVEAGHRGLPSGRGVYDWSVPATARHCWRNARRSCSVTSPGTGPGAEARTDLATRAWAGTNATQAVSLPRYAGWLHRRAGAPIFCSGEAW